jgi:hypothetical protein
MQSANDGEAPKLFDIQGPHANPQHRQDARPGGAEPRNAERWGWGGGETGVSNLDMPKRGSRECRTVLHRLRLPSCGLGMPRWGPLEAHGIDGPTDLAGKTYLQRWGETLMVRQGGGEEQKEGAGWARAGP